MRARYKIGKNVEKSDFYIFTNYIFYVFLKRIRENLKYCGLIKKKMYNNILYNIKMEIKDEGDK